MTVVDAVNAADGSAAQRNSNAVAEASSPHKQDPPTAEQCTAAAAAHDTGVGGPDQEQLAGAGDPSAASAAGEHSSSSPSQNADEDDGGTALPACVGGEPPSAADSGLETVLSLLLPGLAVAAGPKGATKTGLSPEVEHAAPPAFAMLASACASAASWLDPPLAAETAEVLRQDSQTAAAPEEQQAQLKAFLCEQIWPADVHGVKDGPLARGPCMRAECDRQRPVRGRPGGAPVQAHGQHAGRCRAAALPRLPHHQGVQHMQWEGVPVVSSGCMPTECPRDISVGLGSLGP